LFIGGVISTQYMVAIDNLSRAAVHSNVKGADVLAQQHNQLTLVWVCYAIALTV
jgi:hypothetical protein